MHAAYPRLVSLLVRRHLLLLRQLGLLRGPRVWYGVRYGVARPLQLWRASTSHSRVRDLLVHGNDLVAATQGRAIWVLDDVSPLRQLDGKALTVTENIALGLGSAKIGDWRPPA